MKTPEPSKWRAFYFSIGIVLAYMLTRACIRGLDFGTGKEAFDQYDLWMTLPRLLGFLACIAVVRFYGGFRHWGWHGGYSRRGLMLLAIFACGFVFYYKSGLRIYEFTNSELLSAWLRTIPVALFEETCFRGLIFLSLRQRYGAIRAALLS